LGKGKGIGDSQHRGLDEPMFDIGRECYLAYTVTYYGSPTFNNFQFSIAGHSDYTVIKTLVIN